MTRILHVEDVKTVRDMFAAWLSRAPTQAEVVSAPDLCGALCAIESARLKRQTWDMAVLDIQLSNGEFGAELIPRLPGVRIVFVTASPDDAPAGYEVVEKGVGWISAIERMLAK